MKLLTFLFVAIIFTGCIKNNNCDLVIHNARIHTLNEKMEIVEAMAIVDGKIIETGANRQILNKYVSEETYDAAGANIYPGFIDAHCHFLGYGLSLGQLDLNGCKDFNEVIDRIEIYQKSNTNPWIEGRGWDNTLWEDSEFPNNKILNEKYPNTPILIRRIDGHAALANNAALKLADFTIEKQIAGGRIEVLNGKMTGIIMDNAVDSLRVFIPKPDIQQKTYALRMAEERCFEVGLTTVDDAGLDRNEIDLIEKLQNNETLQMRVYAMISDNEENFSHFLKKGPYKTERLNVRSFKFYGDGALGSRGACLLKPYTDSATRMGFLINKPEHYKKWAELVYNAGFQMNTHCIGDSATRIILNTYKDILKGGNDLRWRIEHAQIVDSNDFHYFKDFNILPSVQPTHATSDMRWAKLRVGRHRLKYGYAYKQLLNQNGIIALGTDFPIEDIDPLMTFYAAVARKNKKQLPVNGFQNENRLTREEALKGITYWAAIANFEEQEKGRLIKNTFADFVILNNDILTCPEKDILTTEVIRTYVNGSLVYKH